MPETIQGVQAEERDVTCTMTMSMPDSVKATMPSMSVTLVERLWSAAASERARVPGLWQLSGFELWQNYFMNPTEAFGKMMPEGMKPMLDAMQKDQSATLPDEHGNLDEDADAGHAGRGHAIHEDD